MSKTSPSPHHITTGIPDTLPQTSSSARLSAEEEQAANAYKFMRSLPALSRLGQSEVQVLAEHSRFGRLASGQYISVEGDEKGLYGFIVVSGRLSMLKTSVSGKELVVELLAPGDIFGLLQMLAQGELPVQLSARAQSESTVLWVPMGTLTSILNAQPILYRDLLLHLLEHLQASYKISRGLAHDRVEIRISCLLLSLALKFSRPPPAVQDHTIDITRQQVADLTGTTPETAIRVTRMMQKNGLIEMKHPGIIRVLDPNGLQRIAEGE